MIKNDSHQARIAHYGNKKVASYTLRDNSSPDEISPIVKKRAKVRNSFIDKELQLPFKERLKLIREKKLQANNYRNSLNLKITNNFLTVDQKAANHRLVNHNQHKKDVIKKPNPRLIFQRKSSKKKNIKEMSLESFFARNHKRLKELRSNLNNTKKVKQGRGIFQSLGSEAMFQKLKQKTSRRMFNTEKKG